MIFWIRATDGSIDFNTQAENAEEAFHKLAQKLDCTDFAAMCAELKYRPGDFSLSVIVDKRDENQAPLPDDVLNDLKRQRERAETGVFKFLRRKGQR